MSRCWYKSDLVIGEKLRVPSSLFVEGEKAAQRLRYVEYIGETNTGMWIDCHFEPSLNVPEDKAHYKIMINWASIYCGHVNIYRENGSAVRINYVKR